MLFARGLNPKSSFVSLNMKCNIPVDSLGPNPDSLRNQTGNASFHVKEMHYNNCLIRSLSKQHTTPSFWKIWRFHVSGKEIKTN